VKYLRVLAVFVFLAANIATAKDACLVKGEELLKKALTIKSKKAVTYGLAAAVVFKKGCKEGKIECCDKYAQNYLLDFLASKNIQENLRVLEKGCKKGSAYSCYTLSSLYSQDTKIKNQVIHKNISKAIEFAKKGCQKGLEISCNLYNTLAFLYHKDIKYLKNIEKLCYEKNFFLSCINAARFYANGINTKRDYDKALKLLQYACKKKNGRACFEASLILYKKYEGKKVPKKVEEEVAKLLQNACQNGHKESCKILAKSKEGGKK